MVTDIDKILKDWDAQVAADEWEEAEGRKNPPQYKDGILIPPANACTKELAELTEREGIMKANPKSRRQDPLPPYETLFEIGFPTMKARWLQDMRATDPRYFRSEYVLRDEWPLGWLAWNHSFHVPRRLRGHYDGVKWADLVAKLRDHRFHPDKEFGYVKHDATWEIIRIK